LAAIAAGALSGETRCGRYADRMLRMPIASPHVRSLNLSTAAGIAMYEVLRQWNAPR
jgi:tRNA(Leu) C34 or U34 (ribose-2'-O)-methylase TrmL